MIPLATTTITVEAATETEPGEGRTFTTTLTGVPAHLSAPSTLERLRAGGGGEADEWNLYTEPTVSISHTDRVTDESTGAVFEVVTAVRRSGLGLDHNHCRVKRWTGMAA